MKLALSQEEESQCTFQGGNKGKGRRRHAERIEHREWQPSLARAMRLEGVSRSAKGYNNKAQSPRLKSTTANEENQCDDCCKPSNE